MYKILSKLLLLVLLGHISSRAEAKFIDDTQILPAHLLPRGEPNITEGQFNQIIKNISSKYTAVVSTHGGKLSIQGDWKSEKLNAGATQMFGMWRVQISGALARRPELTPDGFTLILCHELGHHLGGFPFAGSVMPIPIPSPLETWAATEGQSDYFATQVCSRKIWQDEKAVNESFRQIADPFVQKSCDAIWSTNDDQALCYRAMVAVQSMTTTMATLMGKPIPNFETPDGSSVDKTSDKHPAVQCRMDTSYQGAICPVQFDEQLIPGKKTPSGSDSFNAEKEALLTSCSSLTGQAIGLRPGCWFKARM